MHVGLFFLVNVAVALAIGAMTYFQGYGAGIIVLRVLGTLVVLQAVYALWIILLTHLSPKEAEATRRAPAPGVQDRSAPVEDAPRSAQ
ncbi:hypothetical protein [Roseicyclus sp.]|uniref:hypothetical protein n=1 Tax=Roseicyclus sp. TaxID=1914329 RepID=UPI003FA0B4D9